MLKLCGFQLSNYHNKVRLALLEKGVPFEEDSSVHPSQKDEYLALSPMGKVPYAEVDGARLCESEVILEYLEEVPQVKPYLRMLGERPAFARVNADRKAAQEAMKAQATKSRV